MPRSVPKYFSTVQSIIFRGMLSLCVLEVLFLLFMLQCLWGAESVLTPPDSFLSIERLISSCCSFFFFARQEEQVGPGPPSPYLFAGWTAFLDLCWRASQCPIASSQWASSRVHLLYWGYIFLQPPSRSYGAHTGSTAPAPASWPFFTSRMRCVFIIVSVCPVVLLIFRLFLGIRRSWGKGWGWQGGTVLCLV